VRKRLVLLSCLAWFLAEPAPAADFVVTAGVEDNFALPSDPASPSAAFLALALTFQNFDLTAGVNGGLADRQVAHTFAGLPTNIVTATLELKVRAGTDPGVSTDGVLISFVDAETVLYCGDDVVWARSFGPTAAGGCFPVADATGLVGSWSHNQQATLILDLGALPLAGGGTLDLIPQINSLGFIDVNVSDETACDFMRLSIDTTTATSVPSRPTPSQAVLHQPVPNPFNPVTTFRYELVEPADVVFAIYDTAGRRVRTLVDGMRPRGTSEVRWDGTDDRGARVASGLYFGSLRFGSQHLATKAVLLK
jgi:hypothetical protein